MIFSEYEVRVLDHQVSLWCKYCEVAFDPIMTVPIIPTLNDLVASCNKHAHHAHTRENTWV